MSANVVWIKWQKLWGESWRKGYGASKRQSTRDRVMINEISTRKPWVRPRWLACTYVSDWNTYLLFSDRLLSNYIDCNFLQTPSNMQFTRQHQQNTISLISHFSDTYPSLFGQSHNKLKPVDSSIASQKKWNKLNWIEQGIISCYMMSMLWLGDLRIGNSRLKLSGNWEEKHKEIISGGRHYRTVGCISIYD